MTLSLAELRQRLLALKWLGVEAELDLLLARSTAKWSVFELLEEMTRLEAQARHDASLQRRLSRSRLGHFKPMADFDYDWPEQMDRALVERCLRLGFMADQANVIVVGAHGVGKTMLLKNIGYAAVLAGYKALFVTASKLVGELVGTDSPSMLKRRLSQYANIELLLVDELGYLSYTDRAADLLFEIVSRRHESGRPLVLSTNLVFRDWSEVFPNATCTVALVDRLTHRADIVKIVAESWRRKESLERSKRLQTQPEGET